jgi:hypothetical protein
MKHLDCVVLNNNTIAIVLQQHCNSIAILLYCVYYCIVLCCTCNRKSSEFRTFRIDGKLKVFLELDMYTDFTTNDMIVFSVGTFDSYNLIRMRCGNKQYEMYSLLVSLVFAPIKVQQGLLQVAVNLLVIVLGAANRKVI